MTTRLAWLVLVAIGPPYVAVGVSAPGGGGNFPSAASRASPSSSILRSAPDGPSNSSATGSPLVVSPAGSTRPGDL